MLDSHGWSRQRKQSGKTSGVSIIDIIINSQRPRKSLQNVTNLAVLLMLWDLLSHYSDVIMSAMASHISGVSIVSQLLIQAQIKENIKAVRHWPLCVWNSPLNGEFPAQRVSDAENVSIWWRHHVLRRVHDCAFYRFTQYVPFRNLPKGLWKYTMFDKSKQIWGSSNDNVYH